MTADDRWEELGFSEAALRSCAEILRALQQRADLATAEDGLAAEVRFQAANLLKAVRDHHKRQARRRDQNLMSRTGMRVQRPNMVQPPSSVRPAVGVEGAELSTPRTCYVCRSLYRRLHSFYDNLCPTCGDFNLAKRQQTADLSRRTALVTGGRIKIGYQIVLKLLRAGAFVLATTRFPADAARRFASEEDFAAWRDRLRLVGLDLRHLPAVAAFADDLRARHDRLDILINNAAQAVRRPPAFYRHLLAGETQPLPAEVRLLLGGSHRDDNSLVPADAASPALGFSAALSQVPLLPEDENNAPDHFPPGRYDADGQQVDLRDRNSWTLRVGDVSAVELIEAHAINCLAPFLLVSRLEPLFLNPPDRDCFVVNVASAEGRFGAGSKPGAHPHTNMAKASLNMLTRTCTEEFAQKRIFVNSVDPGWVSLEQPWPAARRMEADGVRPPLDALDGAARVLDPVFTALNTGCPVFGKCLKDYRETTW